MTEPATDISTADILAANAAAAAYFASMLQTPDAQVARDYCDRRSLAPATVRQFGLGYAPPGWNGLVRHCIEQKIPLLHAQAAGLVVMGRDWYDFYRGRLMIPIRDRRGAVIGFGARALGDEQPKYLNSRASSIFNKSTELFALDIAQHVIADDIRDSIVVEGYLDAITLHQAGFPNVVATMGTAFTPEHAGALGRLSDRLVFCFDGDAAGRAAARKAVSIAGPFFAKAGTAVRVVLLPPDHDPDSLIQQGGPEAFAQALAHATPGVALLLDAVVEDLRTETETAIATVSRSEALIQQLVPPEHQDTWRLYVATHLPADVRAAAERKA